MEKVTREIATQEFQKWADLKRLREAAIERSKEHKEAREAIIDAIMDGTLEMSEDGVITQNLLFSLSESKKQLKYKPRMFAYEMRAMDKEKETSGKSLAMIGVLTGEMTTLIGKLDTSDLALAQSIAGFYYLV